MRRHIWLIIFALALPFIHGWSQPVVEASSQQVLATGTWTLAQTKLSLADTFAFFDGNTTSLTPFIGETIEICNTSARGNCIQGVIGSVGTGETFSSNKMSNWNMETGDPPTGWNPINSTMSSVADERTDGVGTQSIKVLRTGSGANAWQTIPSTPAGYLFVYSVWMKCDGTNNAYTYIGPSTISDTGAIYDSISSPYSGIIWNNSVTGIYRTLPTVTQYVSLNTYPTVSAYCQFDDVSIKQVLTPSSTGYWIRQLPSSADGNKWNFKNASFDPNSSGGMTYRVISNNQLGRLKAGATVTSGDVHAVIDDGNASITITGTDLSTYAGNDTGGTKTIKNPHSTTAATWTINPYLIVLYDSSGRTATGVAGAVYNTTGLNLFSTPNGTTRNMKSKDVGFDVTNVVRWGAYRQY